MDVEILDCTLRDGGYVNDWNFGEDNIQKIIAYLTNANIDYVECGYLKSENRNRNFSLYSSPNVINDYITSEHSRTKYTFMINYGEINIENIDDCQNENIILRIAFKKQDLSNIHQFSCELKDKGYKIILNPMNIKAYNEQEGDELLNITNIINPYGYTIVDSTGAIKTDELARLYKKTDLTLSKNITIGLHSHNNLQLSFYNAQKLIDTNTNRTLIIDSSVMGMGRGAGNLSTEIIAQYMNKILNYEKYNLSIINQISQEQIRPLFENAPWGISIQYYLSALNNCHQNYAKYLTEKKSISIEVINCILSSIPNNKKNDYDEKLIEDIFSEYAR